MTRSHLQEAEGHSGLKESQVLWLGEEEHITSSGFGLVRTVTLVLLLLQLVLFMMSLV